MHEFAVYLSNLSELILQLGNSRKIILKDKNLGHRLFSVLRFNKDDELIFFDKLKHANVKLHSWLKNGEISLEILETKENKVLSPNITWLLPILKKQALEEALYSLSEIGVNAVQLISTEKSQHIKLDIKYLERLKSIIVSAAEQSKNFNYPELLEPIKLVDVKKILSQNTLQHKIYFDPFGKSSLELFSKLKYEKEGKGSTNTFDIIAMCGPEGDLTDSEKEFLKSCAFEFYALTPTVLRASQAVALGAGILRLT